MASGLHREPANVQFEAVQCSACKVPVTPQEKNRHYRSDWHRYNVKRKCVGMAPLSQSLFESKLASIINRGQNVADSSHRVQGKEQNQKTLENLDVLKRSGQWQQGASSLRELLDAPQQLLIYKCTLCRRTFKSHQQLSSHLATKKHRTEFIKYHKKLRAAQQEEIDVFRATNGDDADSSAAAVPTQHAMDNLVPLSKLKVDLSIKGNPFVEIKPFQKRIPKELRLAPVSSDDESNSDGDGDGDGDGNGGDAEFNGIVDGDYEPPRIPEAIDPTKGCLFCHRLDGRTVDGVEEVMHHMETEHGFFIPRPERLIALQPLLEVAGKVVGRYHQCCWCWSRFVSRKAVQCHMVDKQHCKLMIDDHSNPFREHFDWSKKVPVDMNVDGDEGEWKSNDGRELMERAKRAQIEEINEELELVRSDGTRIGHRLHAVAYKQRPDRLRGHRETQTEEQIIAQINNPMRKVKMELMLKQKAREAYEASGAAEQTKGAAKEQELHMKHQEKAYKVSLTNWIALQKSKCLF